MKLRHVVGGLLATAIVAAPAAAYAGQLYTSYSETDSAGDAGSPSNPKIDVLAVDAKRDASTFSVAVSFADVPKTTRARYTVTLYGQNYASGRSLELVYKADGSKVVNSYAYDQQGRPTGLPPVSSKSSCPGSAVVVNQSAKKLRFVIPAPCFADADLGSAHLRVDTGRWSPATFTGSTPTNPQRTSPTRSDFFAGNWDY